MKTLFLVAGLLACNCFANPTKDLKLVGEGKMKWLAINLYQASLYTEDGSFNENRQSYPVAFSITYLKSVSNEKLIEFTLKEWRKQNITWSQAWPEELQKLWPSVSKNDSLTLLTSQNGYSEFYFNGESIGKIFDPAFGPAFLDIWLDKNTSAPKLRRNLLGQ